MSGAGVHRPLWSFHGGIHPPANKAPSNTRPVAPARLPRRIVLPLHQHIGEPAEPVVQPGARVLKGQVVAHASGYVSAPIHASTSGRVADIGDYPIPHPSGLRAPCVVIEPDGADRWIEHGPLENYLDLDPSALRNVIRDAGIVGLGGAGFPSYIKLNPGHKKSIETLVLNGVECEPYITCDDMLMRERAADVVAGLRIVRHALQAHHVVIAIEDNKPEACLAMQRAVTNEAGIEVVVVATRYPQGSEKQLLKVLTGREVPSNGLALNIGAVCVNVGTCAAVHRAIHLGEPLVARYVTVTGDAIPEPRNLEVPIGTPMDELIAQCGGDIAVVERLIMGGPMMGFALHRADLPVIKTTNCVLALTDAGLPRPQPVMPCIRCGACVDVCPADLLPQQLYWYARNKDLDKIQEYNLFDCIECGCCAYVCPSNIPLVQYYRYAKGDIWIREREKEKADLARRRHEFRLARLEREKAEREARRQEKKAPPRPAPEQAEAVQERADARRRTAMEQAQERRAAALERAQRRPSGEADGDD